MINDKSLKRLHDWLQMKGDYPSVVLALRWIAEFEAYAEEDEDDFRKVKLLARLRAPYDPQFAMALTLLTWAEDTEEPHTRLKRFHDWLMAKGDDPTALLAQGWLAEFEEAADEGRSPGRATPTLH